MHFLFRTGILVATNRNRGETHFALGLKVDKNISFDNNKTRMIFIKNSTFSHREN